MRWNLAGGCALPLPEKRIQVVCLAHKGALSNIEDLGKHLQMQETPSKL